MGKTLFEKVWDAHVVEELPGDNALLAIDRIIAIEITTPQPAAEIAERFGDRLFDTSSIVAIIDQSRPQKTPRRPSRGKRFASGPRRTT